MMRKRENRWIIYVCVLLLFALLAWACGKTVESDPETGTGTEIAEVKSSTESENETEEPESGTEEPETPALETEKETAEKATEPISEETEALSTYVYHIDELDVDLEIPENLYVYRINGVYEDWTGKDNVHDFSTWILVTDKEYDGKEALEESLTENYGEVAEHAWYGVEIIPKELYPVAEDCGGILPVLSFSRSSPPRMTKTGYYCNAGRCTKYLSKENYGDGSGIYRGYSWTEHGQKQTSEEKKLTEKWTKMIEEKTIQARYLANWVPYFWVPYSVTYVGWEDRCRETILDDRFWEVYCQAVEELTNSPEKYEYTDEESLRIIEEEIELIRSRRIPDVWDDSVSDINTNPGEDVYIRAYCYAKYVIGREYGLEKGWDDVPEEITLNDVIVLLVDWSGGQRSFSTCIKGFGNENDCEFACDFDWLCDMTKAREYVVSRRAQEGR